MKKLLLLLMATILPLSASAEGTVQLTMTTWHLYPATDVSATYSATCFGRVYTITATRSPQTARASTVKLAVQEGATSRAADLTQSALGQLMMEPTGFGELRFSCRPQRLFVFYRGATLAGEAASPVKQSAVFALSPEGEVTVPPPEGITVTPVPSGS